jgi:hypothetical protein
VERAVTPPDRRPPQPAGPLDAADAAVLDGVRALYAAADPVPADLLVRIGFALDLENLDAEVFRLDESAELVGARGGDEDSRSITFHSDQLTILVSITSQPDATFVIDGWLTPPGGHRVEVRTPRGPTSTVADEQGRFVLIDVPGGLAQFVVEPTGPDGADRPRSIVTPAIVL